MVPVVEVVICKAKTCAGKARFSPAASPGLSRTSFVPICWAAIAARSPTSPLPLQTRHELFQPSASFIPASLITLVSRATSDFNLSPNAAAESLMVSAPEARYFSFISELLSARCIA